MRQKTTWPIKDKLFWLLTRNISAKDQIVSRDTKIEIFINRFHRGSLKIIQLEGLIKTSVRKNIFAVF